jgi:hypothetical protein
LAGRKPALRGHRRTTSYGDAWPLAKLLGIDIETASNGAIDNRLALMQRVLAALQVERARGKNGSWLYDINRHINLAKTLDDFLAEINRRAHELSPEGLTTALDIVDRIAA